MPTRSFGANLKYPDYTPELYPRNHEYGICSLVHHFILQKSLFHRWRLVPTASRYFDSCFKWTNSYSKLIVLDKLEESPEHLLKMITATKTSQAITITLYSLGIFLGLIHIFFGVIALSPSISQDYHREMKRNYYAFAKSLSILHVYVDLPVLALYLRYFVSSCQAVFGALLLENGHFGPIGKIGNMGLILVDMVYLLLQFKVETSYQKIAPTLVFSLLLVTRLYFALQSAKKMKPGVKTRNTAKPKTSTPKKNKNE